MTAAPENVGMSREEADDWYDQHYGAYLMHEDPEHYQLFIDELMGDRHAFD